METNFSVAQNIKNVREQRKLTLDAAANITGVSRSMLTQIEKGSVNPTITVLWKIANGYKVSFSSLIQQEQEKTSVIYANSVSPLLEESGKYVNYPVFPFDDQHLFETYRIVISPQGKLQSQPHLVGSEEYITVFDGEVEISVANKKFRLCKGDSIKFKADVKHSYKNIGNGEVNLSMLIYYTN